MFYIFFNNVRSYQILYRVLHIYLDVFNVLNTKKVSIFTWTTLYTLALTIKILLFRDFLIGLPLKAWSVILSSM